MSSANLLHFDLSSGCTVQALNAALMDLGAALPKKKEKRDPVSDALLQKTEVLLHESGFKPNQQERDLLAQFCLLLTDLDPRAMSSTRVPLSFEPQSPHRTTFLKLSEFV